MNLETRERNLCPGDWDTGREDDQVMKQLNNPFGAGTVPGRFSPTRPRVRPTMNYNPLTQKRTFRKHDGEIDSQRPPTAIAATVATVATQHPVSRPTESMATILDTKSQAQMNLETKKEICVPGIGTRVGRTVKRPSLPAMHSNAKPSKAHPNRYLTECSAVSSRCFFKYRMKGVPPVPTA
ncbi:hypothetical protein BH11ARM1_BH11ARM1_08950 [soil metagenome]